MFVKATLPTLPLGETRCLVKCIRRQVSSFAPLVGMLLLKNWPVTFLIVVL